MLKLLVVLALAQGTPSPAPPPDASPTLRGVVNTHAQTWAGKKKQTDPGMVGLDGGVAARSLLHPDVNVLDFGADNTGVIDSTPAIQAAIASFPSSPSPFNSSTCGTITFPHGTYRLATGVRVKRGCIFRAASQGVVIAADPGITAFKVERYNTSTDLGTGDGGGSKFIGLTFYNPAHKVPVRSAGETLALAARRKMGPPLGQGLVVFTDQNEFYRHYEVTTAGTTDPATDGPHSFGNDQTLAYNTQTANFTRLDFITGQTSGASGRILSDADSGATGTLRLTSVAGTFQAGEIILDTHTGSAKASGAQSPATQDELDGSVRWKYIGPGSAIHMRSPAFVEDVNISQTSGNGISITAGDLECPACFTNSNGWQMVNVSIATADGHGLYVRGSDSNGGSWFGGQVGGNGGATTDEAFSGTGFNIYDSSFLGNTYAGIEMYTGAGHGGVYSSSIGGGSTFIGCYVEGSPINYSVTQGAMVFGGGLGVGTWVGSGAATGSGTWNPASIFRAGVNGTYGQTWPIQDAVIQPANWRPSVTIPLGIQRINGGKLYTCITPGITAASGGPTGTGSDITDGSVHWQFTTSSLPSSGTVSIGAQGTGGKGVIMQTLASEDFGLGASNYDAYETTNATLATHVRLSRYNFSGQGRCFPDAYSTGRYQAINNTVMGDWPMHVPAGREFWDMFWVGASHPIRITAQNTTSDPACGVWNPGDRIYYSGAAISPGGVEGKICTTGGTAGTYSGMRLVTCPGGQTCTLSGAAMSTIWDQHEFWVGDYLSINGGSSNHVIDASADGLTLTFAQSVTCASCLIAFSPPVFKTFGSISN